MQSSLKFANPDVSNSSRKINQSSASLAYVITLISVYCIILIIFSIYYIITTGSTSNLIIELEIPMKKV
jgi:hypothetical protein